MRSNAKTFLFPLLALLILSAACSRTKSPPPELDEIQETLLEIDAFRGAEMPHASLAHTLSDDATYQGVDDSISTAGLQFEGGKIARVRVVDVLLTTLRNNRAIRIEDYNRSIAESGIDAAKGIYDLMISASANYGSNERQGASRNMLTGNPNTSRNRGYGVSASLEQLLPSGGVLSLSADHTHAKTYAGFGSIDPHDEFVFGAALVQPLLRGFGPYVTNAPIRVAAIRNEIAQENFRDQIITQLTTSIQFYWDLVFAIDNYELQLTSLKRAEELYRVKKAEAEAGAAALNDVQQTQAEVSRREAEVIRARSVIAGAGDRLKLSMNITKGTEQWSYNLIPVDRPQFAPMDLNEEAIFQEALESRPDYRAAGLNIKIGEIDKRVARNARLPQLNAGLGYQVQGLEDSRGGALDEVESVDYGGYNASLTLSHALQNRRAKASYKQSIDSLEQRKEIVANLEEQIRIEVRAAVRAIDTNLKLIRAGADWVDAEKIKLDSQVKRYDVGVGTIYQILEFQEDLADAQVRYLESIINFNKALIELQRVKASFLQEYRVEFIDKPYSEQQEAPGNTVPALDK